MNILSIVASTPSEDAHWWRIYNILKGLKSRNHNIDMICYTTKKKPYESLSEIKDFQVIRTSILSVLFDQLKVLLRRKPDVVIAHLHNSMLISTLGRATKIPIVFDVHGGLLAEFLLEHGEKMSLRYPVNFAKLFLHKLKETVDLRAANSILCVSNRMIKYFHDVYGVSYEKLNFVTNGVDLNLFRPMNNEKVDKIRSSLQLSGKFVFGYLGSLHPLQGANSFLRAATEFKDKMVAFVVVGGNFRTEYPNILVLPRIPRSRLPYYYAICDVLVLPRPMHLATHIAAPTKFAEYVAMGKPVMVTDVGDAADMVRKFTCGIVVKDNTTENLVGGFRAFKEMSQEELRKMSGNSRKLAREELDWNKIAFKLEHVLRDVKAFDSLT